MFSSTRAINQAVQDAGRGKLKGKYVYLRQEGGEMHRIHRAKTVQGDLFIRIFSYAEKEEWVGPCAWGQVVVN